MISAIETLHQQMNIALICPFSSGPGRGNITTVRRIAEHLPAVGCKVTTINLDCSSIIEQQTLLDQSRPDLLHAFHAYHAGPTARQASRLLGIPYMITITGSDLFDSSLCNDPATRSAIQDADAVSCFDPLVAQRLTKLFPHIGGRVAVIPQGVAALPPGIPYSKQDAVFLILLPAALRPVKGVTGAIAALAPLALELPTLRLLLVGGAIDPDYAEEVHNLAAGHPWISVIGDIPYHQMGGLYAAADIVMNASIFEGGMSNALLEAMVMGKPVLARDVLGNRSLVHHGETGWLYRTDEELRECVRNLVFNPELGAKTGDTGREFVQKHCSPQTEAKNYAAVYRRLIGQVKL